MRDLTKRFGDFTAVDSIDFDVARGEIFGFLGPNGSGKTTTIRMLCGVIEPSGGGASVLGADVCREAEKVRQRIGYMSQRFSLFQDLTVDENLRFYAGIYGLPADKFAERRGYILKMADLVGREDELTGSLSVGWKQRLALGCATIHEPELIFLDEPTSGVDPVARKHFWELLYELAQSGVTLFVTTHYMDEATHCNRLAFIYRGRIIADGSPGRIRAGHMQETILEIDAGDAEAALAALESTDTTGEAYLHGALVHVNVGVLDERAQRDAAAAGLIPGEPIVRTPLEAAGIAVNSVRAVEPTLEDVFVHLVGQRRTEAGLGSEPG